MKKTRLHLALHALGVACIASGTASAGVASFHAAFLTSMPKPPTPVMMAIETAAKESTDPVQTRGTLIARLRASSTCYRNDLTADEWRQVFDATGFLPPGVNPPRQNDRFYFDGVSWLGEAGTGQGGTSRRASLTYSFAADGTMWGLTCASPQGAAPSNLDAALTTQFGSLDRGREMIRSSLATWKSYAGLSYTEVADDGSPEDQVVTRISTRGDIRIGGWALGTGGSSPLAYNGFPTTQATASCGGGDMFINTSYFLPLYFGLNFGDYNYLRNTVCHEHGHGLGFRHSVPCDQTKLMEPMLNTAVSQLTYDEVRAACANYGDRYAGNHTIPTAIDYGNLSTPAPRSIIEQDLALNGTLVNINSVDVHQDDWFRFSLSNSQPVAITVTPKGNAGMQALQGIGCEPSGALVNVDGVNAGNLALQLLTTTGTVLFEQSGNGVGAAETISQTLGSGTYIIRVWDTGGAPVANQKTQVYKLAIVVAGEPAPPTANAGLPKRILANTTCQFIGNHNSYPNQPGATIPAGNYAWDLDANGSFEIAANSQPSRTYPSNGVFNVKLRVTDSNDLTAVDTIPVTVFGAVTTITTVSPTSGTTGATVPVTINGTNFRGVTASTQVTVSGTGVTVSGVPVLNALGTQITGLSFNIAGNAPLSTRDITITNSDGLGASGTGSLKFTVSAGTVGACCATDGSCTSTSSGSCTGTYQGNSTVCSPNPCPQPSGACCWPSGTCTTALALDCTTGGATFMGANTVCSPNPCPQPTGACCVTGSCSVTSSAACGTASGAYQGNNTSCVPNPCTTPPGACCLGSTCVFVASIDCTGPTARFAGPGITCNFPGNLTTPCCKANFNGTGGVSTQDVFDFLAAWFASSPLADINNAGGITVDDIFIFLAAWFAGCP